MNRPKSVEDRTVKKRRESAGQKAPRIGRSKSVGRTKSVEVRSVKKRRESVSHKTLKIALSVSAEDGWVKKR